MADQFERFILIVDDEQNILQALKRELYLWAKERQYGILLAQSGKEGLAILAERGTAVELIISDLRMPEMKGSDFLLEVQKKFPGITNLLLTGYSETEEIVKAVSAGIFSYMLKPWESSYLLSEMTKAYEFRQRRIENEKYKALMEEELRLAGELQKAILKPSVPASPGVEFRVSYRPAARSFCSGNYYDVIVAGPDRYLVLIGNVLAAGVQAAMITAILKAVIYPEYVRNIIAKPLSASDFLGWLSQRMRFEFRTTNPVPIQFFAGILDIRKRTLSYSNAGMPHPVFIRAGQANPLPVSGPALATTRSTLYTEQTLALLQGDLLLFQSPGFDSSAGKAGLGALLAKTGPGPDFHVRLIKAALDTGTAGEFTEDVTLITAQLA